MNIVDYQLGSSSDERNLAYISVIVPFYNAEDTIENCITALLGQSYPPSLYEIIMVDNNSTDDSASIITKYPQIKLLSETKQGSYAARNRGVAESRGHIIAFTDSDCVPCPEWLDKISAAMSSPGVGIVQGGRLYSTDSAGMFLLEAYESERAFYTFSGKLNGLYYGYTNNMAVRRDVFDRCGPFVEIMRGADSIFVNRAVEDYSSEVIRYVPDAAIRHLEITGVPDYLRKRFIYGRSLQHNYDIRKRTHRKMTISERYGIIRSTIERKKYNFLESAHLVLLVSAGIVFFMSGRMSVKMKKLYRTLTSFVSRQHER